MRRLLPLSVLLLCGISGLCLRGQLKLPTGPLTPDTLSRYCAAQLPAAIATTGPCKVALDGQYTLELHGDWRLPRSVRLQFAAGSVVHITGGVLDFGGGSIDAPADGFIFPDGDRVRGLAAVRPEWFAASTQAPFPAAGLAAAYLATEPWGTLYLQSRQYVSPFDNCPAVATRLPYTSPRTFVGAGRPAPDSPTDPTRLLGGTILLGGIMGTAPLRAAHLGFDAGPQTARMPQHPCGGTPGIFIEQPSSHEFVSGDRLEDVSVLTMGAFNMHSVMIAGHQNTEVQDLWIWTLGGTHGLVMKSSNSVVDGLHCWGAVSDCLIVKSDYATDLLGRAVHDRVAHVDIHPLKPGETVGGIFVDSSWDTVHSLDMRDITETGTRYSLAIYGSRFYRPHNISIENWATDKVSGSCLWAYHVDDLRVSNLRCGLQPYAGAGVLLLGDTGVQLDHASFTCEASARVCAASQTKGVEDGPEGRTAEITLQKIQGENLGDYLVRLPRPPRNLSELQTVGMGGRVFAPVASVPWRTRFQHLGIEFKPDMRILYTATCSQLVLHPTLVSALILFAVIFMAWLVLRRLRATRTP